MRELHSTGGGLLIRELGRERTPHAVFEGELPTREQLERVAKRKLGVHVLAMPEGLEDLSFLIPLGADLKTLTVTDWRCRDVRAVEQLTGLTELHLWVDSRQRTDLSALRLESLSARWHDSLDSAFDSASLKSLMLEAAPSDVLSRVPPTVERLRLGGIKARRFDLRALAPRTRLTKLELGAASEVDLAGVEELEGLDWLDLSSISRVTNAHLLRRSPSLRKLSLENCRSVEGVLDALEAPALREVLVIGRSPWTNEVNRVVEQRGLEWAPVA